MEYKYIKKINFESSFDIFGWLIACKIHSRKLNLMREFVCGWDKKYRTAQLANTLRLLESAKTTAHRFQWNGNIELSAEMNDVWMLITWCVCGLFGCVERCLLCCNSGEWIGWIWCWHCDWYVGIAGSLARCRLWGYRAAILEVLLQEFPIKLTLFFWKNIHFFSKYFFVEIKKNLHC